jgi:thymidylate synthase
MNSLDKQYTDLLQDILDNGVTKQDRTGTGTISVFGRQIRHKMSDGFPVITTKKMAWKTMVTELIWFLRGDTSIKFLVDNGCHIWDGDAYKNYEKWWKSYSPGGAPIPLSQEEFINRIKTDVDFAEKWGELGPIYGKQWRSWKKNDSFIVEDDVWKNNEGWCSLKDFNKDELYIDQIANLINDLKTNPDSRRLMVNAWNVGELDAMVLPPCHYGFQVYTRELSLDERTEYKKKRDGIARTFAPYTHQMLDGSNIPTRAISLMWNQRSVDTFLGLPFNIASYGLLLEIIAKTVNMVPDELIGNLGDVHLYSNHIEQAKEQIGRELSKEERIELAFKSIESTDGNSAALLWELSCQGKKESEIIEALNNSPRNIPTRTREPYPLPTLNINIEFWPTESGECGVGPLDAVAVFNNFTNEHFYKCLLNEDIQLSNYQSHPSIKAPLSN